MNESESDLFVIVTQQNMTSAFNDNHSEQWAAQMPRERSVGNQTCNLLLPTLLHNHLQCLFKIPHSYLFHEKTPYRFPAVDGSYWKEPAQRLPLLFRLILINTTGHFISSLISVSFSLASVHVVCFLWAELCRSDRPNYLLGKYRRWKSTPLSHRQNRKREWITPNETPRPPLCPRFLPPSLSLSLSDSLIWIILSVFHPGRGVKWPTASTVTTAKSRCTAASTSSRTTAPTASPVTTACSQTPATSAKNWSATMPGWGVGATWPDMWCVAQWRMCLISADKNYYLLWNSEI